MSTIAIVQARMGSTRLPGKIMCDVAGEPMLERCLQRLLRATLDGVVVATTTSPEDDIVELFCRDRGYRYFRGHTTDVLDRYERTARAYPSDVIVRVTSDCPLIDPDLVDVIVAAFTREPGAWDYASNTLPPRTFPRGLDVEAFTRASLARAWEEDANPAWREHVTPYIYRHPELFRLRGVVNDVDLSGWRWTVDTPADLDLVRRIYGELAGRDFGWKDVFDVMQRHPDWHDINREIQQKTVE